MKNKEIIQKVFANTDNYYLLRSDLISQIEDCMNIVRNEALTIPVVGVSLCDEAESNRQDSNIALWTKDSKPEDYA